MNLAEISLKPAFSESVRQQLAERSVEILRRVGALERVVPAVSTRRRIAELLSGMNSYYSNLIEGVKTLPEEVESALTDGFADQPRERDRQKLALAHIETERRMRSRLEAEPESELSVHSPEFFRWVHAEFYRNLPESHQETETSSGKRLRVEPGVFRDRGVTIGRHRPPPPGEISPILAEFDGHFSGGDWLATDRLLAIAAAHHRFAWVHPFLDGNGRVARLASHAALIRANLDGAGLWSLSRGLARFRQNYYEALAAADETEPFEGRKRLSEAGLGEFALFFLDALLEQVRFMTELLDLPVVTRRMERFVQFELDPPKHGEPLARLLKALFVEGEVTRGEVRMITGLRDTAAREVINLAFSERLIDSPSPKGKISLRFPASVLEWYFPKLFLDLPV